MKIKLLYIYRELELGYTGISVVSIVSIVITSTVIVFFTILDDFMYSKYRNRRHISALISSIKKRGLSIIKGSKTQNFITNTLTSSSSPTTSLRKSR